MDRANDTVYPLEDTESMETKRSPIQKHTPSKSPPHLASQIKRSILALACRDTTAKRMRATALTGQPNLWNGEEDEFEQEEGYDDAPSWKRARLTGGPLISEAATLDDNTQEQIRPANRSFDSTFKRRRLIDISQQVALDDEDAIGIKREVFSSSIPACKRTRHTGPSSYEAAALDDGEYIERSKSSAPDPQWMSNGIFTAGTMRRFARVRQLEDAIQHSKEVEGRWMTVGLDMKDYDRTARNGELEWDREGDEVAVKSKRSHDSPKRIDDGMVDDGEGYGAGDVEMGEVNC
jgi:hypothetical protein